MGRMKRKLLLIGDGGHCKSVYDSVISMGLFESIGVVVRDRNDLQRASNLPVIGCDNDLPGLYAEGWTDAFISLGSVGNANGRKAILRNIEEIGFSFPSIVDPTAIIAESAEIGEGVFVGKGAVVNAGATIGRFAIINTGAIVEHDCCVGSFAHVSSGAVLCGGVIIGDEAHVGAKSVVRQLLTIGENALIGMGSVVVKNIPGHVMAYGNPCKVVRE